MAGTVVHEGAREAERPIVSAWPGAQVEQRTHAQQGAGVSDEYRSDKYMESIRHDWAVQGAVATVRQPVHPTTPHMH